MERMKREIPKHCNDLDRVRALENENKRLEEENKKLKENIAWYEKEEDRLREENKILKELIRKAKEFEYDEDGMDYIWQNTKEL